MELTFKYLMTSKFLKFRSSQLNGLVLMPALLVAVQASAPARVSRCLRH